MTPSPLLELVAPKYPAYPHPIAANFSQVKIMVNLREGVGGAMQRRRRKSRSAEGTSPARGVRGHAPPENF